MSAPSDNEQAFIWPTPGLSVEELLAAKGTQPLASVNDLAADTFSSDAELEEFLAFTAAERHRDLVLAAYLSARMTMINGSALCVTVAVRGA